MYILTARGKFIHFIALILKLFYNNCIVKGFNEDSD